MSVENDPVGKLRIEGKTLKKSTNAQFYNVRIILLTPTCNRKNTACRIVHLLVLEF